VRTSHHLDRIPIRVENERRIALRQRRERQVRVGRRCAVDERERAVRALERSPGETRCDYDSASVELVVETGVCYADGEPIEVRVRQRGRRIDVDDAGATVRKAGKPRGWLETAQAVVAEPGFSFNVNRAGVVFVPLVEGRDVDEVATRLARACAALYGELLDLAD
jgi:hypothetical protein